MSKIGVAIVGFGTIGAGVVELLQENRELIRKRTGLDIQLKYVVDIDITRPRPVEVRDAQLTTDYKKVLNDSEVDIVVELVGGVDFAYRLIEEILKSGKNAVTANKALLAEKGALLFDLRNKLGKVIGFEASVGGGIPIIRTIANSLAGDQINAIYGIVNGTSNYILTKMYDEGIEFETALHEAQELGFAEADPTLDIEGIDAAHKIAILGALAFNNPITYNQVYVEGISNIHLDDIMYADDLGYIMKLLAIAKIDSDNQLEFRVHPTLIPHDSQLAAVRYEFNGIMIESQYLGRSMYYGKGAGSLPTATAVVSDIISIAKNIDKPKNAALYRNFNNLKVKDIGEIECRYYIRFSVMDSVGVLSQISGTFSRHNISIASVLQIERSKTGYVPLIMTTHLAMEKNIINALDEIEKENFSQGRGVMIRILE